MSEANRAGVGTATMLALIAGLVLAGGVVACGGPSLPKAAAPQTMVDGDGAAGASSARAEIERLSAEIDDSLGRAEVPAPIPWSPSTQTDIDPRTVTSIEAVCTPPERPSPGCSDICDLGTHICDNAERICQLADELQPDEWSKGKCEDGKKSCEASRKKCCECV